jgi:hypothetical protein
MRASADVQDSRFLDVFASRKASWCAEEEKNKVVRMKF